MARGCTDRHLEGWPESWCSPLAARFSPVRLLGRGGRSTVVEARDFKGDLVAVKLPVTERTDVAPETLRKILAQEAVALDSLAHPSIIRMLDSGRCGEYLVLELLPQWTLAERWRDIRPPISISFSIAAQMATALDSLHRAGFLHLDVKPRNLLLRSVDPIIPVLIDLGSARPVSKPIGKGTIPPHKLGSRRYYFNAPEQMVRRSTYFTSQTDAFAVGATLYWLLTGTAPFSNSTTVVSALRHTHETELEAAIRVCRALPLPDPTIALLTRLLHFDMRERPRELHAIADSLGEAVT